MPTLPRDAWLDRAAAHRRRVDAWVQPHLARRRRGEKHPVHDFLFTYYSQRPAALRRWHPGYGVALLDAPEYAASRGYTGMGRDVTVSREHLVAQRPLIESVRQLLVATASRPPALGCFGLHEWAMVHRAGSAEDPRRHDWPLRLGQQATDRVVESHRIICSHFDAFRFFTPSARPLNTLSPGRDDRDAFEQPGCLHAGMDLYKHAFRLTPLVPSELVADCFALASDIRTLDMRAAPYDFTGVTLDPDGEPWRPLAIETPAGKQEYVAAQRAFARRGAPLRARLTDECDRLLDAIGRNRDACAG
ncbi:MAG TPA: 3-methyladenine DNA glycosylase [Marmoricola sp.]|nr:3-methyladenine DNA glycosylase [Marmoricola sp.]